ncbi:MAG: hypothetical protein JXQ74_00770 [Alphaproteobacteria bacterium]|nr:hypothetical protein [Alphaproteobacteria bacterium]
MKFATLTQDKIKAQRLYSGEIIVLERRRTWGMSNDVRETAIYTHRINFHEQKKNIL